MPVESLLVSAFAFGSQFPCKASQDRLLNYGRPRGGQPSIPADSQHHSPRHVWLPWTSQP